MTRECECGADISQRHIKTNYCSDCEEKDGAETPELKQADKKLKKWLGKVETRLESEGELLRKIGYENQNYQASGI